MATTMTRPAAVPPRVVEIAPDEYGRRFILEGGTVAVDMRRRNDEPTATFSVSDDGLLYQIGGSVWPTAAWPDLFQPRKVTASTRLGEMARIELSPLGRQLLGLDMAHDAPPTKFYQWVVEMRVPAVWVADGFELTATRALEMLAQALPLAQLRELGARILSAPSADAVAQEMGYASAAARDGKHRPICAHEDCEERSNGGRAGLCDACAATCGIGSDTCSVCKREGF